MSNSIEKLSQSFDSHVYTSFNEVASVTMTNNEEETESVSWDKRYPIIHVMQQDDTVSDITSIANGNNTDVSRIMKTFLYTPDDVFSGTRDISVRNRPETNTTTSVARQNKSGRMKEDTILHECGDEFSRPSVQCVNQREYVNQTRYGEPPANNENKYISEGGDEEEYAKFIEKEKAQIELQNAYAKIRRSSVKNTNVAASDRDVETRTKKNLQIRTVNKYLRVQEKQKSFEPIQTRRTESTADESDDESDIFDMISNDGNSYCQHLQSPQNGSPQSKLSRSRTHVIKDTIHIPKVRGGLSKDDRGIYDVQNNVGNRYHQNVGYTHSGNVKNSHNDQSYQLYQQQQNSSNALSHRTRSLNSSEQYQKSNKDVKGTIGGYQGRNPSYSFERFNEGVMDNNLQRVKHTKTRSMSPNPTRITNLSQGRMIPNSNQIARSSSAWIHPKLRSNDSSIISCIDALSPNSCKFSPRGTDKTPENRQSHERNSRRSRSFAPVFCDAFVLDNGDKIKRTQSLTNKQNENYNSELGAERAPSSEFSREKSRYYQEQNGAISRAPSKKKHSAGLAKKTAYKTATNEESQKVQTVLKSPPALISPEHHRPTDKTPLSRYSKSDRNTAQAQEERPRGDEFEYDWKQDTAVSRLVSKITDDTRAPAYPEAPSQLKWDLFVAKIRANGIKMQKKNRLGMWHERTLTFCTEIIWIRDKAHEKRDDGDRTCFPKALIWTKKKTRGAYSVKDMRKRGVSGMLLSKLKRSVAEQNQNSVLLAFRARRVVDMVIHCENKDDMMVLQSFLSQIIDKNNNNA